ncbi:MAG: diacylglycerol kinase family lipid kinase [Planctomycetes bacterium]|jgi:diacylglycerol kinase (ATP)|nr:diacylglycerol kinase family lipid kinase [Planctomycetota bacterium]
MASSTIKTVHLVVNPHSGYGGQHLMLADLRASLSDAGFEVVEYTTRWAGDGMEYVRTIDRNNAAVAVWGGDGTVNEIANGLSGTDVPILPCPAGTENLLAKELRIPSDPARIAQIFTDGQMVNCDVGQINGKNFLLILGIGFDGEVVRRVSSTRTGHISHLSYFWPIWRTFWEHDFPKMKIVADGQEVFNDFGLAFVGNISRYAVGLRICRDALFDDGLLDLVVFDCREQAHLLMHAAFTLLRLHPLDGGIVYRKFKNLTIETDRPVPTQVDGDEGPQTPLQISVLPTQIKLLVPRQQRRGVWPWKEKHARDI